MDIIKAKERFFEFDEIRDGTVFSYKDGVYIKTNTNTAVNLETGEFIESGDVYKWNTCTIYPRASLKLS